MFFDAHADIWTDLAQNANPAGRMRDFHYPRMVQAGMQAGVFVIWVDPPYDVNPQKRTVEIIQSMAIGIQKNKDILTIVRNYSDFEASQATGTIAAIMGMEGLAAIGTDTGWLYALHQFGVRHASLTWNEENALATGARGTAERGLTLAGREALGIMEELGIMVDVSHANEKTFWDICENTTKPFIASHSNCMALCDNRRNLTDKQLKAIAARGGVVGVNAYCPFISNDPARCDAVGLADVVDYMVKTIGIEHVGFGFDFGDYIDHGALAHFQEGPSYEAKDIETIEKVPGFLRLLEQRGYTPREMELISMGNMLRVFKDILAA